MEMEIQFGERGIQLSISSPCTGGGWPDGVKAERHDRKSKISTSDTG
jgi:hypothetical protein